MHWWTWGSLSPRPRINRPCMPDFFTLLFILYSTAAYESYKFEQEIAISKQWFELIGSLHTGEAVGQAFSKAFSVYLIRCLWFVPWKPSWGPQEPTRDEEIYPIVKQIWLLHFMHCLPILYWHFFIKTTAYCLGRYEPSAPSTKELQDLAQPWIFLVEEDVSLIRPNY